MRTTGTRKGWLAAAGAAAAMLALLAWSGGLAAGGASGGTAPAGAVETPPEPPPPETPPPQPAPPQPTPPAQTPPPAQAPPAASPGTAAPPAATAPAGEAPAAAPPRIVRVVCTDRICGHCDGKCHRDSGHVAVDKKGHCACTPTEGSDLDRATRDAYAKKQPQ